MEEKEPHEDEQDAAQADEGQEQEQAGKRAATHRELPPAEMTPTPGRVWGAGGGSLDPG